MGYIIFYIIVVILYIVLRCGRSDTSTQIFFGVKWSDWEKKKEPDDPEKYGWQKEEKRKKKEEALRQRKEQK